MAFPSLSKTGATTVTFSRGNVYPIVHDYEPIQVIGVSYAGTRRVADLRDPDEYFDVVFDGIPTADYTAMLTFFSDTHVRWSANSITFTDVNSVATIVRYLGGRFSFPQIASGLHAGRLPFIREVA